ncbi:hypothetical protein SAMN04488494_0890 [Xylanibacter ruminicola]|uniref:Uncharacterized protein n=1 Tax=Xylanibacter ruminicola TaxID=839 RepID=A0A1M7DYC1_XYLRU|nr:hypothetical protein SAMN04488493_102396 [Xylanibacter ruminicola]SHL84482.1 hypothetical protein SAMN04488494_0890 [Xylanibacter ruminicola]
MTEILYICGIKVIGTNNLKHRNMKKNKLLDEHTFTNIVVKV